ncbi:MULTISPECIES: hypothetical protein [Novosphingobium]|uniref:hypothetical protein n=1 Tax=Novosphingobium TaxID=165696 RepID=UPI001CD3EBB0|nr:hypothetical protein [Novosphingobium percolationis]
MAVPHTLLRTLAATGLVLVPGFALAESQSNVASSWDYLPPPSQIVPAASRSATRTGYSHAVLTRTAIDRRPWITLAAVPPFETGSVAPPRATVSIGDAGLSGNPTLPQSPGAPADSITAPSGDDSTSAELAFFAQTALAVDTDAAQARRYLAAIGPRKFRIYGIMTPEIAAEMLERADRFPGESPKGMPLAEVLAHNRLPKARQVSRGNFVADGTNVIGQPKGV